MKKILVLLLCILCSVSLVQAQTFNNQKIINPELYQGYRHELIQLNSSNLMQSSDSTLFVDRELMDGNYYYVFYRQQDDNSWKEFARRITYLEDTYIDTIEFQNDRLVLGLSQGNTKYFYWVYEHSRWRIQIR